MQHGVLEAPPEDTDPLLQRYEEVLEGAHDLRLEICCALADNDADAFESGLTTLLEQRRDKVNDLIDRGALDSDSAMWLRHFALEGIALLKIAERKKMKTAPLYLHCPDPTRSTSPYMFDAAAWLRVDFQAVRLP